MATLTITTTTQDDARLVVAYGAKLGLGRNATAAEIKADIISTIRAVVADQERIAAAATANQTPVSPA